MKLVAFLFIAFSLQALAQQAVQSAPAPPQAQAQQAEQPAPLPAVEIAELKLEIAQLKQQVDELHFALSAAQNVTVIRQRAQDQAAVEAAQAALQAAKEKQPDPPKQ